MATFPNFIGPSYTLASPNADVERLMNWFPVITESAGAKARLVYDVAPGLTPFVTAPESPIRGLYAVNGLLYAVAGPKVYQVTNSGALIAKTTDSIVSTYSLPYGTTPAIFCSNGDAGGQVFVTYGGKGICLTIDESFPPVVEVGKQMDACAFLNGRVLALDRTNSQLWISNLEDAQNFDPANIIQRSSAPDRWLAVLVANGDIWLLGEQTSDVWYDAGTSPIPFAFKALVQSGIAAPGAAAVFDNAPCWLAQTAQGGYLVVRAVNGYGPPVRISTHAVETAIAEYSTIADATAFAYEDRGHAFFVLSFPTAGATWVYDASTQLWHERAYWNRTSAVWEAYRPSCHAFAYGRHFVGDRASGTIYTLSQDLGTDVDGQGIRRLRRAPHLQSEQKWLFYSQLQIDLDVGIGLTSGQGSDPTVMLRWSNDGGRTWGNELTASAGAIGAYKTRVIWRRLGRARDRVFEVSTSDPVPFRLSGAYLQFRPGTA